MSLKSDKKCFDQILRDRLSKHEIHEGCPLFDSIYTSFQKKQKGSKNIFYYVSAASLLLIAVVGTFLYLNNPIESHSSNTAQIKEKEGASKGLIKSNDAAESVIIAEAKPESVDKSNPENTLSLSSTEQLEIIAPVRNYKVLLADSSVVYLEQGSSVKYNTMFGKDNRKLTLTGSAYFDVFKNKDLTFEISATLSKTVVTGTSFMIKSGTEKDEIFVTSGKVKFSSINSNSSQILIAGMKGTVHDGLVQVDNIYDGNNLAWKTGKLVFKETSLKNVAFVLQEYLHKTVVFKNNAIKECKFSGSFISPKEKSLLDILSLTCGINYEIVQDKIILDGEGCK